MILGEPGIPDTTALSAIPTLDSLLATAAAQRPHVVTIADPPNRAAFTTGTPRVLTFAQADRVVRAIAARLRDLGLQTDSVVAIQLPNTVESMLTCLGVMRAGMIPALLPLLWRQRDIVAALDPLGVKAIVTCSQVMDVPHADIAMYAALELFSIRYVCAFGSDLPDGVVPLDDVFLDDAPSKVEAVVRSGDAAAHVAAITFDIDRDGLIAVARDHRALLAGDEVLPDPTRDATAPIILSALPVTTFAGLALTLVRWLTCEATLLLHHPFDPDIVRRQLAGCPCTELVVPGPLLGRLVDAGLFPRGTAMRRIHAVWRSPELLAKASRWPYPAIDLIDVLCFGEVGIVPQGRDPFGRPTPLAVTKTPFGPIPNIEVSCVSSRTVGLCGAMVPRYGFPPSGPHHVFAYSTDDSGVVDTDYPCRLDNAAANTLVLTGPQRGIVTVGGCRFRLADIEDIVRQADPHAVIVPAADNLLGQRLSGHGADQIAIRARLAQTGAHPLIGAAFRGTQGGVQAGVQAGVQPGVLGGALRAAE